MCVRTGVSAVFERNYAGKREDGVAGGWWLVAGGLGSPSGAGQWCDAMRCGVLVFGLCLNGFRVQTALVG